MRGMTVGASLETHHFGEGQKRLRLKTQSWTQIEHQKVQQMVRKSSRSPDPCFMLDFMVESAIALVLNGFDGRFVAVLQMGLCLICAQVCAC